MNKNVYFFTGFPGFIATQIIQEIIHHHPGAEFLLLVHPSQADRANRIIDSLVSKGCGAYSQYRTLPGDITLPDLGLDEETQAQIKDHVQYLFHLAAIYDLAVLKDVAYQVNVLGTENITNWACGLPNLKRYVYFSTAYVSGNRTGRVYESELDKGQGFKNFYESTKFEAEKVVQAARSSVPTTIIRPGIVMGNSETGETVKFDGPYFIMRMLDRFAKLPIPYVGKGEARLNVVPVDYIVQATCYLSHDLIGEDKVYHLTDPSPYKARDVYRMICEALLDKRPSFTLPSSVVSAMLGVPAFRRWVQVEKEAVEYFDLKAEYDCSEALRDLAGSGIACPDFAEYIPRLVTYYKQHRDDPEKIIVVR
jgi:thioester reductase-like protein